MTFHDLPENFSDRPITDPDLFADVVDLCASERARALGGLQFLLTDPQGRMIQPIDILEVSRADTKACVTQMIHGIVEMMPEHSHHGIVVFSRPGSPDVTEFDLELRAHVEHVCTETGFILLGFALAVPGHVVTLDNPSGSDRLRYSA